ncbi:helix-turn-helix domain-containing protein [Ekhidna sp. To15]|uniref:helix-turn-helix domain-containing protein n=1 Tax=Ekhidna sp. To15 TaxID=3395267 RepID=UPI003F525F23
MSLDLTISEIIYLFAAFHGVFLASLIVIKKSFRENVFLFLLILLFSFYLLENVIYSSGYIIQIPHLYFTTLPVIFLIGPFFYLYIRSSLKGASLKAADLLHLAPFLFEFIILIPFYALDAAVKVRVYEMSQQSSGEPGEFNVYFFGYLVYIFSTLFYVYRSYRLIKASAQNGMKAKEMKKYFALREVSVGFFFYVLISISLSALSWTSLDVQMLFFHVNLTSLTILIHAIGYIAFLSPSLLESNFKASDYQYSAFDDEKMKMLRNKLDELFVSSKPYLKSAVSASDISNSLNISNHELSQLLNVGLNISFYDLINQHRIDHAKELLLSKEYQKAKILHIALDSGFSNKSSFLRNFKKLTTLTPTEFKKLQENQVPIN